VQGLLLLRWRGQECWCQGLSSSAAVPHMIDGIIDRRIDIAIGDISDLLGSAVKEDLQFLRKRQTTLRWRNLLWRNGGDADLLVRSYGPIKKFCSTDLTPCSRSPALCIETFCIARLPLHRRPSWLPVC
jgi:hypothetical protein